MRLKLLLLIVLITIFSEARADPLPPAAPHDLRLAPNGPNRLPVALDDLYDIKQGTRLLVSSPGVLSNDSNPDGDSLTASLLRGPYHGLLQLQADGSFTYTPEYSFHGSDSFVYVASDGRANSNQASVSITVAASDDQAAAFPALLFSDGFEVGGTSKWSVATGFTTNLRPRSGMYCLAVPYENGGTQAMIKYLSDGIAPLEQFYVSFWIRIAETYHAPYLGFKWARFKHGQTDGIQTEFFCNSRSWTSQVVAYQTGGFHGNPSLNWDWYSDGMADHNWHRIEIFGKYNNDGQADGILRVWGDGHLKFESTTFTWRSGSWANDIFKAFYLPSNAGDGTYRAQSGDIVYYDDVEIWNGIPPR